MRINNYKFSIDELALQKLSGSEKSLLSNTGILYGENFPVLYNDYIFQPQKLNIGKKDYLVIATDESIEQKIMIDFVSKEVLFYSSEYEFDLINSNLEKFIKFQECVSFFYIENPELDEELNEFLTGINPKETKQKLKNLKKQFKNIDPKALRDENNAWNIFLEEFEYRIE